MLNYTINNFTNFFPLTLSIFNNKNKIMFLSKKNIISSTKNKKILATYSNCRKKNSSINKTKNDMISTKSYSIHKDSSRTTIKNPDNNKLTKIKISSISSSTSQNFYKKGLNRIQPLNISSYEKNKLNQTLYEKIKVNNINNNLKSLNGISSYNENPNKIRITVKQISNAQISKKTLRENSFSNNKNSPENKLISKTSTINSTRKLNNKNFLDSSRKKDNLSKNQIISPIKKENIKVNCISKNEYSINTNKYNMILNKQKQNKIRVNEIKKINSSKNYNENIIVNRFDKNNNNKYLNKNINQRYDSNSTNKMNNKKTILSISNSRIINNQINSNEKQLKSNNITPDSQREQQIKKDIKYNLHLLSNKKIKNNDNIIYTFHEKNNYITFVNARIRPLSSIPKENLSKLKKFNTFEENEKQNSIRYTNINKSNISSNNVNFRNSMKNEEIEKEKYEIGKILGKGAYATVKMVTNKITNEKYAMKIYDKEKLNSDSKINTVIREIQILKNSNHENIVKLIEVINTSKQILIIEELIEGISLREYYDKEIRGQKGISEHKSIIFKKIFKQIFSAMDYLHKNNIAHRDIKLENILINKNYLIKILDFGFGMYNPDNILQTFYCGTPNYMAPEIAMKKPYVGQNADLWSLGVLVYKIFAADFPFKGKSENDLYRVIEIGKFNMPDFVPKYARKIICSLIVVDPNKRISCEKVLNSSWLKDEN